MKVRLVWSDGPCPRCASLGGRRLWRRGRRERRICPVCGCDFIVGPVAMVEQGDGIPRIVPLGWSARAEKAPCHVPAEGVTA